LFVPFMYGFAYVKLRVGPIQILAGPGPADGPTGPFSPLI
jgi:hypothetical protein